MPKIEELKTYVKVVACVDGISEEGAAMTKITLAAIEDAQRYKKDENGLLPCGFCGEEMSLNYHGCAVPPDPYEELWNTCCWHCGASPMSDHTDRATALKQTNFRGINAAVRAVLEVTGGGE